MTDEYKTITEVIGEGFYSEKRSKFLAFAHHVETIDEIKDILASYRKKYYDARHVCYAYVLGADKANFRANDDGEPSSTAGKPILGQINSYDLTNVLVIVVRYYGGVNLGTGGLIVRSRRCFGPRDHRNPPGRGSHNLFIPIPYDECSDACHQRDAAAHCIADF